MSLEGRFASMKHGDVHHISQGDPNLEDPVNMSVRYEAEQAMGDNGRPAKGYTVGHYHVHGPGEDEHASFRHSPQGPTLTGAKGYAARQAADHVSKRISAQFHDRRATGMSNRDMKLANKAITNDRNNK